MPHGSVPPCGLLIACASCFLGAVANEEVRWYLRDERLQAVLRNIDGAGNREAALAAALQAPNFKEFADKVLAVAAPEPPS